MNSTPSPAMPRLVLLALTLAVLLIHGWLLQVAPRAFAAPAVAPAKSLSFITRTVMALPIATPPSAKQSEVNATRPNKPAASIAAPAPKALPAPTSLSITPVRNKETPQAEESGISVNQVLQETTDNLSNQRAAVLSEALSTKVHPAAASSEQDLAQLLALARPEVMPPPSSGVKLPAPMRLKYTVLANKFPFSLTAELFWQHDDAAYNARLAFSAFGQSRVQTSQGNVGLQGLAPIRFSDKYRAELAAHFNREAGKITFSANTPDAPLMPGAQDRLSVLVQLAALISNDPGGYPQTSTITLQTAGPRDASPWLFTLQAPETLVLPGGTQATLKLIRLPRRDYDQTVEVWLAPALGYLPARVRITEHNGDYIDQQWQSTEATK